MDLLRRALGQTTLEITTLGFGTWAIGGGGWAFLWGPQDDAASLAAMRHPVEQGINWIGSTLHKLRQIPDSAFVTISNRLLKLLLLLKSEVTPR